MDNTFFVFAKQNQDANNAIIAIINNLSNEEREKNRGSYYGSLSGLVRHIAGGTSFFMSMYKTALADNADAQKVCVSIENVELPEGELAESQWKTVAENIKIVDAAFISFVETLKDSDLDAPVELNWFGGNPPSVPLSYMIQSLIAHGLHHRGQISQILDEMKIDNDYSGISPKFLHR